MLLFMTISTYLLTKQLNVSKEIIATQQKNIEGNRKKEILSYLKPTIDIFDLEVLLLNKDTVNFKYNKCMNPSLLYYFSINDCNTCVDENINLILKCFLADDSINVVLASSESNFRDLYLKQRVNYNSRVKYGIIKNITSITTNFFVFVNKRGQQSNVYYPVIGKSQITEEYLRSIREYCLMKALVK